MVAWSTKDLVAASLRLRANLSRKTFSLSSRLVIYSVKKKTKTIYASKVKVDASAHWQLGNMYV